MTICSLSVYSLVQTSVYSAILEVVQERVGAFNSLPQILPFLIWGAILFLIFLALSRGGESFANVSVSFSALLYLPAVIPHSGLNWLEYLGLKIQSRIAFWETLLIGVTITAGYLMLYLLARVEESVAQLRKRGARKETTHSLSSRKFSHSAALTMASFCLAVSAILLVKFLSPTLGAYIGGSPIAQIVGCISVIAISLTVIFYIHSKI